MLYDPNWKEPEVKVLDEIGQHLLRAADYIDKNGWCQGNLWDPEGKVCAFGAIMKTAKGNVPLYPNAVTRLGNYLNSNGITSGVRIFYWNDKPFQTKENVIEVLRKAAYSE